MSIYASLDKNLEGPAVMWQSPKYTPLPAASSAAHDFGLHAGQNRGMFGAFLHSLVDQQGYTRGDTIQLVPDYLAVGGSPGGQLAHRVSPGRITTRTSQDIYSANRTSAARIDIGGSATFALSYRGIFAGGPGPYAPDLGIGGPMLAGETPEFTLTGTFVEVANPTDLDPHMWTLFGRCLAAEGGCTPGEIMAFGSSKNGSAAGFVISYSPSRHKFTVTSQNGVQCRCVGKDGTPFVVTPSSWACFLRFSGRSTAAGGGNPRVMRSGRSAGRPLRLWATRQVPFSEGLVPVGAVLDEGFTPVLAQAMCVCKREENGYRVGDWIAAQEGHNIGGGDGGFTAVMDGRTLVLAPNVSHVQKTHSLVDGAWVTMTAANWSWFFVFVG
jgi:hypothetical protein